MDKISKGMALAPLGRLENRVLDNEYVFGLMAAQNSVFGWPILITQDTNVTLEKAPVYENVIDYG